MEVVQKDNAVVIKGLDEQLFKKLDRPRLVTKGCWRFLADQKPKGKILTISDVKYTKVARIGDEANFEWTVYRHSSEPIMNNQVDLAINLTCGYGCVKLYGMVWWNPEICPGRVYYGKLVWLKPGEKATTRATVEFQKSGLYVFKLTAWYWKYVTSKSERYGAVAYPRIFLDAYVHVPVLVI